MKTNAWISTAAIVAAIGFYSSIPAGAAVIFSQDFSSSPEGPVSTYVNSSSPDSGQWNAISTSGAGTTVGVTGGALTYTRGVANVGSFSRTTDFNPTPDALIYSFVLTVSGNSVAQTTAATWQVGSGFGTANAAEANASVHSRFAVNFTTTDGTFQFRDIGGGANSGNFSGSQSVTWIINNSGSAMSYVAPDSSIQTIADDAWDLWAGSVQVFDEIGATTTGQSLTDLKFAFVAGSGIIAMDNFSIQAVPEPTTIALGIFAAAFLAASGARAWLNARRARLGGTANLAVLGGNLPPSRAHHGS